MKCMLVRIRTEIERSIFTFALNSPVEGENSFTVAVLSETNAMFSGLRSVWMISCLCRSRKVMLTGADIGKKKIIPATPCIS